MKKKSRSVSGPIRNEPKDVGSGRCPFSKRAKLQDREASASVRRHFLFHDVIDKSQHPKTGMLFTSYLMARWSAVESHLSVMTEAPVLPEPGLLLLTRNCLHQAS